ncbi:hypothetical protein PMAYCL1PPCAC_10247, partial [Pristionchus mayeri]
NFDITFYRACAAFFKRTKSLGKQYACRTRDGRCAPERGMKFRCRACRYERCVAVGMEYEGLMRLRRNPVVIPVLDRMKTEAKVFMNRRRERELSIINVHGGNRRIPHPTEELYDVHPDTCIEIFRLYVEEAPTFFISVFPAFTELDNMEHEVLFKDFIGKMGIIEAYYRTRQLFGESKK